MVFGHNACKLRTSSISLTPHITMKDVGFVKDILFKLKIIINLNVSDVMTNSTTDTNKGKATLLIIKNKPVQHQRNQWRALQLGYQDVL